MAFKCLENFSHFNFLICILFQKMECTLEWDNISLAFQGHFLTKGRFSKNWVQQIFLTFEGHFKVQTFWEAHKNLRNLPHALYIYLVNVQILSKIFSNFECFSECANFNMKYQVWNFSNTHLRLVCGRYTFFPIFLFFTNFAWRTYLDVNITYFRIEKSWNVRQSGTRWFCNW